MLICMKDLFKTSARSQRDGTTMHIVVVTTISWRKSNQLLAILDYEYVINARLNHEVM